MSARSYEIANDSQLAAAVKAPYSATNVARDASEPAEINVIHDLGATNVALPLADLLAGLPLKTSSF